MSKFLQIIAVPDIKQEARQCCVCSSLQGRHRSAKFVANIENRNLPKQVRTIPESMNMIFAPHKFIPTPQKQSIKEAFK